MEAGAWEPAVVYLAVPLEYVDRIRRRGSLVRFVVFQEEKDPAHSAAFGAVWMQSPLSLYTIVEIYFLDVVYDTTKQFVSQNFPATESSINPSISD